MMLRSVQLLTHKDTEVQQLTIDCLLTYRPPYLVPYQYDRAIYSVMCHEMIDSSIGERLLVYVSFSFSSQGEPGEVARQQLIP